MTEYEKQKRLIKKIIKHTSEDDPDYKKAKEFGFIKPIAKLMINCRGYSSLCVWLVEHDMRIFYEFRFADIRGREDFDSEEAYERAKADCLMISDDGETLCMSW